MPLLTILSENGTLANVIRKYYGCKRGGAGRVLEFSFPSPSVNAIPISVPNSTVGIIFLPVSASMDLYLKPSPPHHPSKVSNNYISKFSNKHITKVSNKNTCLKQKYFNINSKSSKVNQSRIISSLSNSISHSHPHPHPRGYHLKPIPIPIPAAGMNFIHVPAPWPIKPGPIPAPMGRGWGGSNRRPALPASLENTFQMSKWSPIFLTTLIVTFVLINSSCWLYKRH